MFALAIVNRFSCFGFKDHGRKLGALVLSIAKWLRLRKSTGAIGVFFPRFDFNLFGEAGCDFWFVHESVSAQKKALRNLRALK